MSARRVLARIRPNLFLLASASILAYLSYGYYESSRESAILAHDGLERNRRQAREIERIRHRPIFAAKEIEALSELTRRIATARNRAGMKEQAVDLVDPQSPVRLRGSSYRQRPVAIDLRGLTLAQTVRFADALTDRESGMWVNQIRLSPVRSDLDQLPEVWNIKLVLT